MTSELFQEFFDSPHTGVIFKRTKLGTDPRKIVPVSLARRYAVFSVPELPLYMQYIHQGTPDMYERNAQNEPVLKDRPWPYTVLSDAQGQAPWVKMSGFTLPLDDCIEAHDFFDTRRRVSLDIVYEPEGSDLSVVFEQLYMTAYLLFDTCTGRFVCGDKTLISALLQAPRIPPPKMFVFA